MSFRLIISGLLALLLSVSSAPAQVIHIHTADGTESFNLADIDSITFDEEEEGPLEREFQLTDDVSITMVWIPPGEFMMGAQEDEQDSEENEDPRHRVTLDYGFWMGKYEVTQAQWEAVTGSNPSYCDGENRPVEMVSWDNIHEDFLSQIDDDFRLPSEAEWEYACRAGTETRFYWGDDPDYEEIDDYAVYCDNDDGGTAEVGTKRPNAFGLYDMSGNLYEWCEDWYHDSYEGAPDDGSPWLDNPVGSFRVPRGGSWYYNAGYCRSANRYNNDPSARCLFLGFRLARDAD